MNSIPNSLFPHNVIASSFSTSTRLVGVELTTSPEEDAKGKKTLRVLQAFDQHGKPDIELSKAKFRLSWIAQCPDLPSESAEMRELSDFVNTHFASNARTEKYERMFIDSALFCDTEQLDMDGATVHLASDPPGHDRVLPSWTVVPDQSDSYAFVFVRTPPKPVMVTCWEKTFFQVRIVRQTSREFAFRHIPDFDHVIDGSAIVWEPHLPRSERLYQTSFHWDDRNQDAIVLSDDLLIASVVNRNSLREMVHCHDLRSNHRWHFNHNDGSWSPAWAKGTFDKRRFTSCNHEYSVLLD